jgi:hypothetical protein
MATNAKQWKRLERMWYGFLIAIGLIVVMSLIFMIKPEYPKPTLENRVMYARQLALTVPFNVSLYVDRDDDTVLIIKGPWKQQRYDAFIERINRDMPLLCKMGFEEYHIVSLCLINEKGEEFCSSQDQEIELVCPKPVNKANELGK